MADTPCSALLEDWLWKPLKAVADQASLQVQERELRSLTAPANFSSMKAFAVVDFLDISHHEEKSELVGEVNVS